MSSRQRRTWGSAAAGGAAGGPARQQGWARRALVEGASAPGASGEASQRSRHLFAPFLAHASSHSERASATSAQLTTVKGARKRTLTVRQAESGQTALPPRSESSPVARLRGGVRPAAHSLPGASCASAAGFAPCRPTRQRDPKCSLQAEGSDWRLRTGFERNVGAGWPLRGNTTVKNNSERTVLTWQRWAQPWVQLTHTAHQLGDFRTSVPASVKRGEQHHLPGWC